MASDSIPDCGFLSGASERLKDLLEGQATEIRLGQGDILFEQGDDGDALFAITEGSLEFSILSAAGRKLSLDIMRPGAIFGEIALFDPGPRTATATALEPSRVRRIRNPDVLKQIEQHPELAADMIRLAGQRMRWMNMQLNEQVFLPISARLARKLLHLTGEPGSNTLSMSQSELAEFVGATREAVSKTISAWKRTGVIEATRGGLIIQDRAALTRLADPDLI
ncbi:MAG: cyclic nucleotide-binding domain-containing protein [Rhodobacteraceae bacterium]|nr:cyclic nucleotide-binding domain-containing protein [Paracoccaceae bacterium]